MTALLAAAATMLLGALAVRYGTDSRPVFDERPEPQNRPRRSI